MTQLGDVNESFKQAFVSFVPWVRPISRAEVAWLGEPMTEPAPLWLSPSTVDAMSAEERRRHLWWCATKALDDARRAKRRAQKAHSKACRLTWMAEQGRV